MRKENWYNIEFVTGAIAPSTISNIIAQTSLDDFSGASNIFLGRIRADKVNDKTVNSIEYTCYEEMATVAFSTIIEEAKNTYPINTVHLIHSMGEVKHGELCLMVMVDCGHRKESFHACEYIVERLKKEVPIWGKEIFENETHQWKINQ
jgi:molybdopterin synthase catalytic subunit